MSRTRAEWVLPTSMLLGTFAWSFVYVSLPFHIQRMSTLEPAATLRWTGWILGISPLITVITAPISGRLGERIDPRRGFVTVQAFQGLMGPVLATTLLSSLPPAAVYLALAALGVAVVPLVARMDRRSRFRDDPGGGMTS